MHIRKDDSVIVISGDEKGKKGKVLRVSIKKNRIFVQGINLVSKHLRKGGNRQKGDIIKKEAGIDVSNIMLFCDSCNKGVRVGFKVVDEKKVRYCKKCNKEFEEKNK